VTLTIQAISGRNNKLATVQVFAAKTEIVMFFMPAEIFYQVVAAIFDSCAILLPHHADCSSG
jgi:hypothetical protein